MFWTLFDQSKLDDFYTSGKRRFKITQQTGEILFGAFSICVVLVGVNMLIAMMNKSYEFFAVSVHYEPVTALVYLWQYSTKNTRTVFKGQAPTVSISFAMI